jgi:hypothetical protein
MFLCFNLHLLVSESESMESVGTGEYSQTERQQINSPNDNVESETIDNPLLVIRRPTAAVPKRLAFPGTTSRPSTSVANQPATQDVSANQSSISVAASRPYTPVVTSRPSTSGVGNQRSSVSSRSSHQLVIPAIDTRLPLVVSRTTPARIVEASVSNRPVLMAIEELPVRPERLNGIENMDNVKIFKGILKLTVEVNELKDLIKVLTKICVCQADNHNEGSESLDEIPISSVEDFKAFEIKLKDSGEKYSSLVCVIITRFSSGYFIMYVFLFILAG